ncbi:hypothetical protein [Corynebacterium cystitidis]|uniref:hypothetical protein n=1 Tax=Corynebacterium cystitidis TaxID=35757 RepID=UPI00211EC66E|nr:hypothetical protein [Corynebacterium cystitidis]
MIPRANPLEVPEFRLSITRPLADQLLSTIDSISGWQFTLENIEKVAPQRAGLYQLYLGGNSKEHLVYVGKSATDINKRLHQRYVKISGRTNISCSQMFFKAVYVHEDLDAVAPEKLLINEYKKNSVAQWNFNGAGGVRHGGSWLMC